MPTIIRRVAEFSRRAVIAEQRDAFWNSLRRPIEELRTRAEGGEGILSEPDRNELRRIITDLQAKVDQCAADNDKIMGALREATRDITLSE